MVKKGTVDFVWLAAAVVWGLSTSAPAMQAEENNRALQLLDELIEQLERGGDEKNEVVTGTKQANQQDIKESYAEETRYPLHAAAAIRDNAEEIERLINDERENVHGVDENGDTPLHIACRLGLLDNARALTEHGANPRAINQKSPLKRTPLREALAKDQLKVFKHLVTEVLGDGNVQTGLTNPDGTGKTPAHDAMWEGTEEIVRWMLGELQNQDLTKLIDKAQRTLLHFVARNEQCPEVVTLVLEAEPGLLNLQDRFKMTPLDVSIKSGIDDIDAARANKESLFAKESGWKQREAFLVLLANGAEFGRRTIEKGPLFGKTLNSEEEIDKWKEEPASSTTLTLKKALRKKQDALNYLVDQYAKLLVDQQQAIAFLA